MTGRMASIAAAWVLVSMLSAVAMAAELVIAEGGRTRAAVCVEAEAGKDSGRKDRRGRVILNREWERRAADDLAHYAELMTGTKPDLLTEPAAIEAALKSDRPVFVVGELALKTEPDLRRQLSRVAKKDPVLRADAVVLRRAGNRVYLAGTNDDSHYFAAAELLRRWGCRWFMPTAFGEVVPIRGRLTLDDLDYAYGSPFEVRRFWLSWNASTEGSREFLRRNFMNEESVPSMHTLSNYVKDLVPPGKTHYNIPISDPKTAEHVAAKVEKNFAAGERFSLGMNDGIYRSDYPPDRELLANIFDKYFQLPSMTEPFLVFYNRVAKSLQDKYPQSLSKIGFLAYTNVTIPPQRRITAERSLVAYLAPIDIDPNHGMDDPLSPPRQEFGEIMRRWATVMQGRLVIYDYDQGPLVWRDLPAPSQQAFVQDVRHYRDAGILGVDTESRGAYATTFTNLYLRGQLLWDPRDPEAEAGRLLDDFYPAFYGPAAEPMSRYWGLIFDAWKNTLSTEHEFFMARAIYTPDLVAALRPNLEAAEKAAAPLKAKAAPSRLEKQYIERMAFTRMSFDLIDRYVAMQTAAATQADYAKAAEIGDAALALRAAMLKMNPMFLSTKLETGWAWWPGEVQQYRELNAFTNGEKGKLVALLPLEWAFHRDPNDTGLVRHWAGKPVDLTYWNQHGKSLTPAQRKDYPTTEWETVRADEYTQTQGIRHPDGQTFTGYTWYRADLPLTPAQAARPLRVKFPGLFSECWLYVNGDMVAHRTQQAMWWNNDYRFEWDADLTGQVVARTNTITLRVAVPHHVGGLFRRPFVYEPMAAPPPAEAGK